jgi:Bromodomain
MQQLMRKRRGHAVQVKLRRQQRLYPCVPAPEPSATDRANLEKAHRSRMADFMQRHCKKLLQALMDRPFGHVFNTPVDTEKYPNYKDVVDTPMDFGTIRSNIDAGGYGGLDAFVTDVNLVLGNARNFNAAGSLVHHMADALQARPSLYKCAARHPCSCVCCSCLC